jgi:uncharacterized protein YcbK (DUF882 family)
MKRFICRALVALALPLACFHSVAQAETRAPSPLELLMLKTASKAVDETSAKGLKQPGTKARTRNAGPSKQTGASELQAASRQTGGAIQKQTPSVSIACFKPSLNRVLRSVSARFGSPVIVTSGYRSPGQNRRAGGAAQSYHMQCMAADIKVAGVSPGQIARYARTLPSVGGVGFHTYTSAVHIDVGPRVATWVHGGSRKRFAKRGGPKRTRIAAR